MNAIVLLLVHHCGTVAMWREVPESLLPRWSIGGSGRLRGRPVAGESRTWAQLNSEVGLLVLSSPSQELRPGPVDLAAGWDLTWVERLLGAPFEVTPEQPLIVSGLPPGLYTLTFASTTVAVSVSAGKVGDSELE